jgi:hypothetical protein
MPGRLVLPLVLGLLFSAGIVPVWAYPGTIAPTLASSFSGAASWNQPVKMLQDALPATDPNAYALWNFFPANDPSSTVYLSGFNLPLHPAVTGLNLTVEWLCTKFDSDLVFEDVGFVMVGGSVPFLASRFSFVCCRMSPAQLLISTLGVRPRHVSTAVRCGP